jgi:hypothetical protein
MDNLKGVIVPASAIDSRKADELFELMDKYYGRMSRETFLRDLYEKDWVLLLTKPGGDTVEGFTTILLMETVLDGKPYKALYSGDTIIEAESRGQTEIMRAWLNFAIDLAETMKGETLYWFLISKGYRTYKLLPLHARDYYPRYDKETPPEFKRLLDAFATQRFGPAYDPKTGVIKPAGGRDYLKSSLEDITPHRLSDPHIKFFIEKNPGFHDGDELACITVVSKDNLARFALKILAPPGEAQSGVA